MTLSQVLSFSLIVSFFICQIPTLLESVILFPLYRWPREGKQDSGSQEPSTKPKAVSPITAHHLSRGLGNASPRGLLVGKADGFVEAQTSEDRWLRASRNRRMGMAKPKERKSDQGLVFRLGGPGRELVGWLESCSLSPSLSLHSSLGLPESSLCCSRI